MTTALATTVLAFTLTLGSLAGCGEDAPPASDAAACGALEMGPYVAITATVSKDAFTPAVVADAKSYTITLPAAGIGYVKFDAAAAGDHVVFLDRDVPLMAQTSASAAIPPKTTAKSSDACVTIKGRHVFTLAAGTSFLGVGPDAGGPVNLVVD